LVVNDLNKGVKACHNIVRCYYGKNS